jgi:hypothetical protein
VLGAGDVAGAAAMEIAIRIRLGVELEGIRLPQHFGHDGLVFGFGTVAKDDPIGLGKLGGLVHPGFHRSSH